MSHPRKNTHPIGRSSITGQFITIRQAQQHPRTTEVEHIPNRGPAKSTKK